MADNFFTSTDFSTRMKGIDPGGLVSGMFQPGPGTDFSGDPNIGRFGANPYAGPLADLVGSMPGYKPITAQGSTYTAAPAYQADTYKAKDMSQSAMPQYDAMRARLNSQYSQTQSQAQDALDRQFATMGGGPGGAALKQTENLATGIAKQKSDDLQGINAQEAQARQDLQNQENQKEFQSGEAQKGYAFQSSQNEAQRRQAAEEAAASRGMSAEEFNRQMDQNENQFKFQAGSSIANLNTAWDQAMAESTNNEFNKQMEQYKSKHSGGLLGGGGLLGTGLFNF